MSRTVQQLFDLKGKTALVTGGSRGLGLQMAHALGEAGAKIIVSSRKAEDLVQAVAELKSAGIDADYIAADCSKETDIRALEADETQKLRKGEVADIHIQRLMPADALRIRGRHNAINALSALALASAAGCALGPMLYGLREYRGEPHRVQPIGTVNGIEFFDDSKGTNVGATVAALQGLGAERKVVLILGGEGKGQDFSPLARPVSQFVRAVVLIGRDAPMIRAALADTQVPLHDAPSMADAVNLANAQASAGDAVLMSPACASFDMFKDYAHRAQVFVQAVEVLAADAGVALEVGL